MVKEATEILEDKGACRAEAAWAMPSGRAAARPRGPHLPNNSYTFFGLVRCHDGSPVHKERRFHGVTVEHRHGDAREKSSPRGPPLWLNPYELSQEVRVFAIAYGVRTIIINEADALRYDLSDSVVDI